MSAKIIDGKAMSDAIKDKIALRVRALAEKNITPGLAVVLVGSDPASEIYVRNKEKACEQTGVYSRTILLPEDTTQEKLESVIDDTARNMVEDNVLDYISTLLLSPLLLYILSTFSHLTHLKLY